MNLVLGIDLGVCSVGASIVSYDENGFKDLIKVSHVKPSISTGKGIQGLIKSKDIFESEFLNKMKDKGITECVIEAPILNDKFISNPKHISDIIMYKALISESIYKSLNIVPSYVESTESRYKAFPWLIDAKRYDRDGNRRTIDRIIKDVEECKVYPFGCFTRDCDKKGIIIDAIREVFPDMKWSYGGNSIMNKKNFEACDSLVCSISYINSKINGPFEPFVKNITISENEYEKILSYTICVWGKEYDKSIIEKK